MKLYKDYKEEQEYLQQEAADREVMELRENMVIVYERGDSFIRKAIPFVILLILLLVLAGMVTLLVLGFYGFSMEELNGVFRFNF